MPQSRGSVLFFPEDFIDLMENLFFGEVADPLGDVGGEASPALPCISSSAVHWPGGDALVEPFMFLSTTGSDE